MKNILPRDLTIYVLQYFIAIPVSYPKVSHFVSLMSQVSRVMKVFANNLLTMKHVWNIFEEKKENLP